MPRVLCVRQIYTSFLPRSTIRQRSNDHDRNSNTGIDDSNRVEGVANVGENHDGGEENDDDAQSDSVEQNEDEDEAVTIEIGDSSGSTREITPKDIVATLDVEEEEEDDDDCDEDDVFNQYNGEQIFNGLITGMNEVGQIRIQSRTHTDSHDRFIAALEAFKATSLT